MGSTPENADNPTLKFFKGKQDILEAKDGSTLAWSDAASRVREQLNDAMNAQHLGFLFGSGCSSYVSEGVECGIPTMAPLAKAFISATDSSSAAPHLDAAEAAMLKNTLGIDLESKDYESNLERLLEVLHSLRFVLGHSCNAALVGSLPTVTSAIAKVTSYILYACSNGAFAKDNDSVVKIYQAFYRNLSYRGRNLPRPWIFTTNYDLFNETALDRLGMPYSNGFIGTVERRFNPASFRYSLAEQLDISSRRWSSVDGYLYLCKLHGSINWVEAGKSLFPLRELQLPPADCTSERVMIYPTPAKQNASFGYPYSDLFREFQHRTVRDQSVLFVIGHSFGDEHINNIIFQALTIPTFRLIAFCSPGASGVIQRLRALNDPRIWIIGGDGPDANRCGHYFDVFVEHFMPEPPGNKIDTAIEKVMTDLSAAAEEVGTASIVVDNE
jgi:SIR2-like domain